MAESTVQLRMTITAEEYLKSYAGTAKSVHAVTLDGRRIQFPASILRPFVTREGIQGHFAIDYDENNRFSKIEKLA